MHCFMAGRMPDAAIRRLEAEADLTYEVADAPDAAGMTAGLARADILLLRATPVLTAEHVRAAPRLKVVSRYGVGYDNVALAALNERRIPLLVVGDNNSTSVAEGSFALMLACARRLPEYDAMCRNGEWRRRDSLRAGELAGKHLLVIGFGRIGRKVASRAAAFEMKVHAYDPVIPAADIRAAGAVPETDLDAALAAADFVSVHVNLTEETRRLLNAERFARMKPHAIVVNASRGGVVDEAALAEALRDGTIGGAGIDVFEQEPIRPDCLLLSAPNVILSPHAAGLTREAGDRMAIATVENALAAWRGEADPALVVNREVLR